MLVANKKKTPAGLIISWGLLLLSILATGGIYFYNSWIEKSNIALKWKVAEIQSNIEDLKKDDKIQVASLISKNKLMLQKKEYFSQIPTFFKYINEISETHSIDFESFKYRDWVITMDAVAQWWQWSESYKKIVDFIKEYREDDISNSQYFDLWFVQSFENDWDIRFEVNFEVKPNVNKKLLTGEKNNSATNNKSNTKEIILEKLKKKGWEQQ